jgi:hypothetical protein
MTLDRENCVRVVISLADAKAAKLAAIGALREEALRGRASECGAE